MIMAKDRFKIKLVCPQCGKDGEADAYEDDGWAYMKGSRDTTVTSCPDGFKVVHPKDRKKKTDIHCEDCLVSAVK